MRKNVVFQIQTNCLSSLTFLQLLTEKDLKIKGALCRAVTFTSRDTTKLTCVFKAMAS